MRCVRYFARQLSVCFWSLQDVRVLEEAGAIAAQAMVRRTKECRRPCGRAAEQDTGGATMKVTPAKAESQAARLYC